MARNRLYYQAVRLSPRGQRDHLYFFDVSVRGGWGGMSRDWTFLKIPLGFCTGQRNWLQTTDKDLGVTKQNRNLSSGNLKNLAQKRSMNQGGANRWAHRYDHALLAGSHCCSCHHHYKVNIANDSANHWTMGVTTVVTITRGAAYSGNRINQNEKSGFPGDSNESGLPKCGL